MWIIHHAGIPSLSMLILPHSRTHRNPSPFTLLTHFQPAYYLPKLFFARSLSQPCGFLWVKNLHRVVCLAKELWLSGAPKGGSFNSQGDSPEKWPCYSQTQTEHSLRQVLLLLTTSQCDDSSPSINSPHPACFCHTLRTPMAWRRRYLACCFGHRRKLKAAFWGWMPHHQLCSCVQLLQEAGTTKRDFSAHPPPDFSKDYGQTWALFNARGTEVQDCHLL